ncbi:chemotaxis protein CheW [Paenibacillus thalictri]|uniref:Chemotaxis protein CheW n=1 Tax=Paenibacillus thalictri TaxID=2527873 RepID=A0A4Q9DLZ1_9BACL|nr:chemotaxis protein CheW [Paenibacillus thalictri]TBL75072.1 chemotaxis protein CheW [Paenibacillus thalictri]
MEPSQYIEIGLNDEKYALPIGDIQEIIRLQTVTEIPNSEPELVGVINLRGKIVPVMNLSKRFLAASRDTTALSRIVIVQSLGSVVGLLVDRVFSVISFPEIGPPPHRSKLSDRGYIGGIGRSGDEWVCILKLENVLHQGGISVD